MRFFLGVGVGVKKRTPTEINSKLRIYAILFQGGPFYLFGYYLDELLLKLKKSGIGCHIGNIFTGALAYADDVVLLAPTKHAMSLMLKICSEFSTTFDLIFNADKSYFIHFPCRSSKSEKLQICFDGKTLTNTSRESHLGHIIGSNIMNSRIQRCGGSNGGEGLGWVERFNPPSRQ